MPLSVSFFGVRVGLKDRVTVMPLPISFVLVISPLYVAPFLAFAPNKKVRVFYDFLGLLLDPLPIFYLQF
jgi:hypothetical protein